MLRVTYIQADCHDTALSDHVFCEQFLACRRIYLYDPTRTYTAFDHIASVPGSAYLFDVVRQEFSPAL
jgi:hypothetical protein